MIKKIACFLITLTITLLVQGCLINKYSGYQIVNQEGTITPEVPSVDVRVGILFSTTETSTRRHIPLLFKYTTYDGPSRYYISISGYKVKEIKNIFGRYEVNNTNPVTLNISEKTHPDGNLKLSDGRYDHWYGYFIFDYNLKEVKHIRIVIEFIGVDDSNTETYYKWEEEFCPKLYSQYTTGLTEWMMQ